MKFNEILLFNEGSSFQVIHLSIRLQEARRTFKKKKDIVRVLIRENDRNYDISMQNSSDEYLTFFVHDG